MKIGILLGSTFVGGMERQTAYLGDVFLRNGHEVFIYTSSSNFSFKSRKKVSVSKKNIYPLYNNRYISGLSKKLFVKYLNKHQPDVLIAFQVGSIEMAVEANDLAKKSFPVIANLRGIKFAFDDVLRERHIKACKAVKLVLCNSRKGKELIENLITKDSRIPVKCIENIVKVQSQSIDKPSIRFYILFAANLKRVKDPLTFLKAINVVIKQKDNIYARIAGNGPLIDEMRKFVADNDLNYKVEFLGALKPSEVPYKSSHLVVSSSIREASSNTILEALANYCCVVGTRTGGTTELLENKSYGALFEVGDYEALAKSMITFSEYDHNKLIRDGRLANQYIINNHSEGKIYNEYIRAITSVIS
ncbi:glycosyltransferase family 4 protein [Flavobacteriaceae bacterium]|nr:glycosyltransferase family 4 protein [Flavobacteriaceae bacterium]